MTTRPRAFIEISFRGAVALLVGFALTFGATTWKVSQINHSAVQSAKQVKAADDRDIARNRYTAQVDAYNLCVAVKANGGTLKDVIDTSYKGAAGIDPSKLPAATQQLVAELEPVFLQLAAAAKVNQAAVIAKLQKPPTCTKPPTPTTTVP